MLFFPGSRITQICLTLPTRHPRPAKDTWNFKSNLTENFKMSWRRHAIPNLWTLLTFSLLISEDFWVFLSCLSDRNVFVPSDKCSVSTAIAGKIKKTEILSNYTSNINNHVRQILAWNILLITLRQKLHQNFVSEFSIAVASGISVDTWNLWHKV